MKEETNTHVSQIYKTEPSFKILTYFDTFDYDEYFENTLEGERERYPYQSYYEVICKSELLEQEDYETDFQMIKYISSQNPNLNTISELMKVYYENFEGLDEFWNEDTESAEALNERMLFSVEYYNQMKKIDGENIQ